jgi:beta-lactamase superfamily II metal-dependent hydrolase
MDSLMSEVSDKISIRMLKAGKGDSFFVTWKDTKGTHAILVDTGVPKTAHEIQNVLNKHPKPIDAMIITHIDDDHVGGAIELLKNVPELIVEKVSKIVINTPETINIDDSYDAGVSHGITLLGLLKKCNLEHLLNSATSDVTEQIMFGDAKITILSPSTTSLATAKMIREWKIELQE